MHVNFPHFCLEIRRNSEEVIPISRSGNSLYLPTCRENQPLSKASCFCIVKHWGSLLLSFYLEIFLMKGKGLNKVFLYLLTTLFKWLKKKVKEVLCKWYLITSPKIEANISNDNLCGNPLPTMPSLRESRLMEGD